jgi:hypothetical protein
VRGGLFLTALVGLLAGAVGALLVSWFLSEPTPSGGRAVVEGKLALSGGAVPPGWDHRFLTRLTDVEGRLSSLEQAQPASEPAGSPEEDSQAPQSKREQERLAHYEVELAHQHDLISKHEGEPLDADWAVQREREIAEAMQSIAGEDRRVNVSCRSKTCVAEVTYPTPMDAVEAHVALATAHVERCNGTSSALEPPDSAGPYTVKVIHFCR